MDPLYHRRLSIQAPQRTVFDAVATVAGPRSWWTTEVKGSAAAGGELTFSFAGTDEQMVMYVAAVEPMTLVQWTCTAHTRDEEWTGSRLRFAVCAEGEDRCTLDFHHEGVPPGVVAAGWEHFLTSLAAHAEHGGGTPYSA